MKGTNILIPMGGKGERFKNEGYTYPKPLIKALGKPILFWLLDCLKTSAEDVIYIGYQESSSLLDFEIEDEISRHYPKKEFRFIRLQRQTKGAAETVHVMASTIETDRRDYACIIFDSDTFYHFDVLKHCRQIIDGSDCAVLCFETQEVEPIYSYVQRDEADPTRVIEIAEKRKISDYANTGCYMFQSTNSLLVQSQRYLETWNERESKEPYVSLLIRSALKEGSVVSNHVISVSEFTVLGTPFQLKLFCMSSESEKYRFCFDLDGTLIGRKDKKYEDVYPIERNISFLKFLKSQGHYIIVYTARRMRTHHGNVGAVIADIGEKTYKMLQRFGIPYDELIFGKPYAHFYIDDLAINANVDDLNKTTGFYESRVTERNFNTIKSTALEVIEKSSTSEQSTLDGEIYWYENMPTGIQHLFPQFFGRINGGYRMEKIKGIPFSFLFQQGNLKPQTFQLLLSGLDEIHQSPSPESVNIYKNYKKKLTHRFKTYYEISYADLPNSKTHFDELTRSLEQYEEKDQGIKGVVHGDPVFSNVLLVDNEKRIKFIDMRGKQDTTFTLQGDVIYDWAKVYQCLMGYDFVLAGKGPKTPDQKLMEMFSNHIGSENMRKVELISKTLVFSLIPLHDKSHHCRLYKFFDHLKKTSP